MVSFHTLMNHGRAEVKILFYDEDTDVFGVEEIVHAPEGTAI